MIGPLKAALSAAEAQVEAWFAEKWRGLEVPLYCSVDIRNSHDKIAVVDTNAFPAGFNNLCKSFCDRLADAFSSYLGARFPGRKKILVVPEAHTRNRFYLESVRRLAAALATAGFEPRVATVDPAVREDRIELEAENGKLVLHRLRRDRDQLLAGDFVPDLVINNNDLSAGPLQLLEGIATPIVPPLGLGWHRRSKHRHFTLLNAVIADFARAVGLDPWLISTAIGRAEVPDFNHPADRDRLALELDRLLAEVRAEYERRHIQRPPRAFIKNDAGTYGMAVMTAASGAEVRAMNRKTRVKMSAGKGGSRVATALIQEAIPTLDAFEGSPMEPVVYLVGDRPVGGFYRLHRDRGELDNLNVPGMEFKKLCFHQVAEKRPESLDDHCEDASSLLLVYGTLARLAAVALALEAQELTESGT